MYWEKDVTNNGRESSKGTHAYEISMMTFKTRRWGEYQGSPAESPPDQNEATAQFMKF